MSDFVLVSKKRRKKKCIAEFDENSLEYLEKFQKKLEDAIATVEADDQYKEFQRSISQALDAIDNPSIKEVICYGLGNISRSNNSLYQYSLIVKLSQFYQVPLSVYDPIFTGPEAKIFARQGTLVIPFNDEALRVASDTTLFFLPHCPRRLFDNLLRANWAAESLTNCIVVGDSLSKIVELTPSSQLKVSYERLYEARECTTEVEVENNFKYDDVFNDFAVHVFPRSLTLLPPLQTLTI